jgi:transposase-like protein
MAKPRMDLSAFVGKLLEEQDGDGLRDGIRVLSQALMETEVAGLIGAERHERTADRAADRHGFRTRTWDTRVGTIELAIPKVRPGTYFPSLLQPRRRAEHALLAVVQEAYGHGVATRKVDELMRALGLAGGRSQRCRGSAASSIPWSPPFGRGRSAASIPTSGSTRRTTRCA